MAEEEAHGGEAAGYYYEVGFDKATRMLVGVLDGDKIGWTSL